MPQTQQLQNQLAKLPKINMYQDDFEAWFKSIDTKIKFNQYLENWYHKKEEYTLPEIANILYGYLFEILNNRNKEYKNIQMTGFDFAKLMERETSDILFWNTTIKKENTYYTIIKMFNAI